MCRRGTRLTCETMGENRRRMNVKHRAVLISVILLLVMSPCLQGAMAQEDEDALLVSPEVERLMAQMSPEEKVGQLFLVTFIGNDVSDTSDVARLIREGRVGGVVLSPSNANFVNDDMAPGRLVTLTNDLQALAITAPLTTTDVSTPTVYTPIPLLIALNQEGDGYPFSDLRSGMTPLPGAMALGATWNPVYAQQAGLIVGQELTAIGINMLLGPSLDVLARPIPTLYGTLGSRTFGGDPYWVGKFGKAYIRGVHEGGEGRLLTVAKHFPGLGGTDRNPEKELPTIQKSLETLRSVELAPFFAVTGLDADDPLSTTDALMTSHVRYRGFQGNIRQLSRPISLDAQNLPAILGLPEFAPWREAGGLLISDKLGVPSIRKFYDPTLQTFPAKRIAQEAFLAGNDLLYLSQFDLNDDWPSQLANMEDTILFFREKYASDPTFQMRVDESAARILQRKLDMMGDFTLENVQVPEEGIFEVVGQQRPVVARAAQGATTLIYPGVDELTGRLPSPPLREEQILIITDDRRGQECVGCVPFYFINPLALESLVLRLYGPEATGQISADQVHSMTFSELKRMLAAEPQETGEEGAPEPVEAEVEPAETEVPEEDVIDSADWIIFAMLDMNVANYPDADALTLFLRERSGSLQGKKLIVLAFNGPYYLDSTEVSKLTAYYGLYGKTQPYLETAVRLLFQEFQPRGSSPVDVDAIGYQIIEVTRPDPNQVINIEVVTDAQSVAETTAPTATPQVSPEGTPIPIQLDLEVGDVLTLRTGMIVDRNGRQVADGTPVEFRLLDTVQSLEARLPLANTVDGVATASFNLDRSGTWQITAVSDTAQRSVRLILAIPEKGPVEIGFDRPTPTATTTPTPSPTATNTAVATATSTPTPTPTLTSTPTLLPPTPTLTATLAPTPVPEPEPPGKTVNAVGLFLSVICLALIGGGAYRLSASGSLSPGDRVERSLVAVASGLLGYVLFGSGLVPLERVPFIARAVDSWLPYEVLPVVVCLVFAGLGLWLAGIRKAGQVSVDGEQSQEIPQ